MTTTAQRTARDMHAKVDPVVAKIERFTATATAPFTDAEVRKIKSDRELLHGSVWTKLKLYFMALFSPKRDSRRP